MVVKEIRGRRRYIAFKTDSALTRESLIRRLKNVCGENTPYVVQCGNGMCVIRCAPDEIEQTINQLHDADSTSVSLASSGTLRTIRSRYPLLKESIVPRVREPKGKKVVKQ